LVNEFEDMLVSWDRRREFQIRNLVFGKREGRNAPGRSLKQFALVSKIDSDNLRARSRRLLPLQRGDALSMRKKGEVRIRKSQEGGAADIRK